MSGRPEELFPLFAEMESLPGLGAKTSARLSKAGLEKPRDLIYALPHSGVDRSIVKSVADASPGQVVTVAIRVLRHLPPPRKGRPYRVMVEDASTAFSLVWFRTNDRYIMETLPIGEERIVSGKLEHFDGQAQIVHPEHVLPLSEVSSLPEFEPVYALTEGVTAKVMTRAVAAALERTPDLPEWVDPHLLEQENWPSWHEALEDGHHPTSISDLSPTTPGRSRLAYDEFFANQLTLCLARNRHRRASGIETKGDDRLASVVRAALEFAPTAAQDRAVREITADMARSHRMNRLLQGDVGSGKTYVAFMALLAAVEAGGQGVLMAPTEILARQHLQGLKPLADTAGVELDILTGRDSGAERRGKLERLASGTLQILVGTHAVFQDDVHFEDLRLAIVDEQHRFGVRQRLQLSHKGARTDVLVMTATPIPRSLSMTQFGDMDISILDEKPPGRKPVKTALMSADRIDDIVAHLQNAVSGGAQAYWVCPLVAESESMPMIAAEERFKTLRKGFPEGDVGLVHGQMPSEQKDDVMARFVAGDVKVLVSTTVIEVGVNVPNASIMVIEQAESFGLAQLHQLRGRVGRGSAESTCLLLYHAPLTGTAARRLQLLRETEDGFRIAEEDLAIRGAGDVLGVAQSGLPRFRIADLESQQNLMKLARNDARNLLELDPELTGKRGQAARKLLWLLDQDRALQLLQVG